MSLERIDRKSTSLAALVHHKLREAILSGQLKSGENLVEDHLSLELGVSRSPLREALARLEQEGLITSIPYRGAVVAGATRAEIMQAIQIRQRLEPLAIELSIDAIPTEEIDGVMGQIERLTASGQERDPLAYYECDQALHSLAPRHANNPILEQFLSLLEDKVHTYRLQGAGFEDALAVCHEHMEILQALRRRDGAAARAAMVRHLELACERLTGSTIRE
jgi:DNA-binding GntR family transcriptional regulator